MNDELPPAAQLAAAARLVSRARAQLDVAFTPCGECGRRHFRNPRQAQLYEQLDGTAEKLQRVAQALTQPDDDRARDERRAYDRAMKSTPTNEGAQS